MMYGKILLAIIIIITIADTGTKLYTLYPIQKGDWWYEQPQVISKYKSLESGFDRNYESRIFGENYNIQLQKQYLSSDVSLWDDKQVQMFKNNREIMPAFNMLYYNVPIVTNAINSAGLKVKWYSDIENVLFFPKLGTPSDHTEYSEKYIELLRLTGSKYIIHDQTLSDSAVEKIYQTSFTTGQDQIALYKVREQLPFIQIPENINFVESDDTFDSIKADSFNPDTDAVIESKYNKLFSENFKNDLETQIKYTVKTPEKIELTVVNSKPVFISLRQAYFPDWVVRDEKAQSQVIRTNHAFQGIYVSSEGQHNLTVAYEPVSFSTGLKISIVSMVVFLGSILFLLIAELRQRNKESTLKTKAV